MKTLVDNSFFLEKLKDKSYVKQLKEKIIKEKESKNDFTSKTQRVKGIKNHVNLEELIRKYNLDYFIERTGVLTKDKEAFLITSRGELVPYLFTEIENFPNIVSFKNILGNYYLNKETYPIIVEKIAERFARSPYGNLISIDEAVTLSSLLFRTELLRDLKIMEEVIGEKILPNLEIHNFVSPNYYGENSFFNYSKERNNNFKKIKELIDEYNLPLEIRLEYVNEIPWQDNDSFYDKIAFSYLPFPRLNYQVIRDSLKGRFGKEYIHKMEELFRKVSEEHKKLTKNFLEEIKKEKAFGINGLYVGMEEEFKNKEGLNGFLKKYAEKSAELTAEILEKYFKGITIFYNPEKNAYSIERIKKKSKRGVIYQNLAEVYELNDEKEDKPKSGLRLILSVKK